MYGWKGNGFCMQRKQTCKTVWNGFFWMKCDPGTVHADCSQPQNTHKSPQEYQLRSKHAGEWCKMLCNFAIGLEINVCVCKWKLCKSGFLLRRKVCGCVLLGVLNSPEVNQKSEKALHHFFAQLKREKGRKITSKFVQIFQNIEFYLWSRCKYLFYVVAVTPGIAKLLNCSVTYNHQ